jgi:two-component system alkaline phosphatase synthesis response regulator PhoP
MSEKILIIEDDESLAKGLKLNLKAEGYEVEWAGDGQEGLRKAAAGAPDLILLDLMLPKMQGLEVCKRIREMKISAPIIMLTAKGGEVDKVVGLEVGADDYMSKPFSLRELLARIKAHLRRERRESREDPPEPLRVGDAEVDFAQYKVRKKGRVLELTALETEILMYLAGHRGEVVTREALLDKVWGYDKYPTTRTVDNHILKLRKKIEEDPNHPRHILSVYGGGYRFVG